MGRRLEPILPLIIGRAKSVGVSDVRSTVARRRMASHVPLRVVVVPIGAGCFSEEAMKENNAVSIPKSFTGYVGLPEAMVTAVLLAKVDALLHKHGLEVEVWPGHGAFRIAKRTPRRTKK